jgi:cytoskeletal protein CcmA (bactofilin family)
MAMQSPFFGKRENETLNSRPLTGSSASGTTGSTGAATQANPAASTAADTRVETAPTAATEGGSKLTVGPNIKLKGVEITDCDTLVVEGLVEATMDSRVIQIAEIGSFKGSADIDIAEIHGLFDGNLTVRQKLTIYSTGKVTGKIRYGKIVIEEGGQLSGEIEFGTGGTSTAQKTLPLSQPQPQTPPIVRAGLHVAAA